MKAKTTGSFFNGSSVCFIEIAFGKAEIINGIKQVGFPRSIQAANSSDAVFKRKCSRMCIPELGKIDMIDFEQNRRWM